jgi:hypothetical protein
VITHAHVDHARPGHARYLAARACEHVPRARLGEVQLNLVEYGEVREIGGVRVSLHPAGHVLGSAQVRIERGGEHLLPLGAGQTRMPLVQWVQDRVLPLRGRDSAYGVGRTRGDWWKWKVDPYSVDAVLVYAQRGHGRRASLYTDYTFAVWHEGALVPFAKAYSGLTDAEIREVDEYVRRNTNEKFGPVRSVVPKLVMEIGFEGIQRSARHKSGVAVRFPRMLRIRYDKPIEEADTLASLHALIEAAG